MIREPHRIPEEIKDLLMNYHLYHGDKNVKPVRQIWFDGPDGQRNNAYLVRLSNRADVSYSVIDVDQRDTKGKTYIVELTSAPREDEVEMIDYFVCSQCPDDYSIVEGEEDNDAL